MGDRLDLQERAERLKENPFRTYYDKSLDNKYIDSAKKRFQLEEKGLTKLSLNEAYRHLPEKKKFKVRIRTIGLRNFEPSHRNIINTGNNKFNADLLGHLGLGFAGLSGEKP